MPLLETYGSYQLVEKLAMGGMAQLYLARRKSKGTDRTVVLKRILPHLAEDTAFVTMFLDEARIAARLHHPNVIEILDLGAEGDSYFIAMEYIHGEDLRRITKRGIEQNRRMPSPLVCRVIAEACRGLDYAHKRTDQSGKPLKIVHRDVSPQNILVGFDGTVKVVDFGIAKAADKATVTASGVIKGKHAYMSPEQALGREIDHRTDVFALGIVLFEALTATRLFRRATDLQTLKAVSECKVEPPSRVFPAVPQQLDAIILRALTKDLAQRYQTALQLAEALEGWLGARSDGSREALAEYVSDLFHDRLEREAREGKFLPTQSQVTANAVSRNSNPNAPTASIRAAQLNKTVTSAQTPVPPSPLESRNTDVTPAFVPPDSPLQVLEPIVPAAQLVTSISASQLAKPVTAISASQLSKVSGAQKVITDQVAPVAPGQVSAGEPGGTTPYGRPLAGSTAMYGKLEPKTITEVSDRIEAAISQASKPTVPASILEVLEVRTDREIINRPPRMWPWWLAAGLTTIAVAAGVAKVLVDRKDMLFAKKPITVMELPPETSPAAAEPHKPQPQPPPQPPVQPDPPAPKKTMTPFGTVPVSAQAYPLTRRDGRLFAQLSPAAGLKQGTNVRIVGPPRGGTRDRDFYGVASVVELNGNDARLLFDDAETLPDGLFVSPEAEQKPEGAGDVKTPEKTVPAKGVTLVGSVQLKKDDPEADVAVKNATDFDWTHCEVRLPDARSLRLTSSVVVKAGATQWITGTAFKSRGGGGDARLSEGFALVKCAEGDGYLKAAYLP